MYNNSVEKKTETATSVVCDAGVGAHREGFTVPNVLKSDFVNLFVYTHTHHTEVLGFCVLHMQQS